jgi:hypothetical protein
MFLNCLAMPLRQPYFVVILRQARFAYEMLLHPSISQPSSRALQPANALQSLESVVITLAELMISLVDDKR